MPVDPALPALEHATDAELAREMLAAIGRTLSGEPLLLSHREGQRAVVRLRSDAGDVFCKIVRPGTAERLVALHRGLRGSGLPVPKVLGFAREGFVLVAASDGTPGPDATLTTDPETLLDAVDALRAHLASARIRHPARASLSIRAPWFVERLREALPGEADALERLDAFVGPTQYGIERAVPIHGDLHIGQLFFDDGAVTGLIDVDTVGQGDPDDDSAAFIAHAAASALANEEAGRLAAADALGALADAADARWLTSAHARALAAVHLLGHACRALDAGRERRAVRLIRLAGLLE